MIFINEWLANPAGNDASGEWVELFNSGSSTVNLAGWKLVAGSSKFSLTGQKIGGGEYLVLPRSQTKLALRNTDGELSLYDAGGQPVDSAGFVGSAPEGKSFARAGYSENSSFIFSDPTPGALNTISAASNIIRNTYPLNVPLVKPLGTAEFFGLLLGTAIVLTAIVMFVLKRNEDLSKLFFRGDEEIR
jgi:hypothetical protein